MSAELSQRRILAAAALFVFSGAASLMHQVVWLRYLSLIFGNTTYAAATLLAVFMGGLGLGALIFGRLADRLARPLLAFAAAEVAIGLIALISPRLLGVISDVYVALYRAGATHPAAFAVGRMALAAVILLPPTILMGGTLPLLIRGLVRKDERRIGGLTALLYAVNTLGAVAGTAFAGFLTIRILGLRGTLVLGAAGNLVAAIGCLMLSRPLAPLTAPAIELGKPKRSDRRMLALFALMGASSLGLEVLWTRILVFYLGSSVYAYSLMLVLFLTGVGLGSLLAAPLIDRLRRPIAALGWLELLIAGCVMLQIVTFQRLNDSFVLVSKLFESPSFADFLFVQLLAILPILGPPTLLMGISFPLAVRLVAGGPESAGRDVGQVYGANTLGAVFGSLGAGFVLIPWIGTQNSLLAIAALNAGLGAALLNARASEAGRYVRRWALLAPVLVLVSMALFPADRVILSAGLFRNDKPENLLHFSEDASTSVTIRRLQNPAETFLSLELNGVNVAGTGVDLYAVQLMQGHLPMMLGRRPQSVVHIGFGSGGTAHAVSRHPVESILIVEISPSVLAASDTYFEPINHGVLNDERVRVEINDGRNFLLATEETFDALLSDSIHPRYSGNGSLYSRDYFEIARERMQPDGVISMWLPMYTLTTRNYAMILRAFREVFPHTTVWYEASTLNSFTIVTGQLNEEPWHEETVRQALANPKVASELATLGIRDPGDLLVNYLAGGESLGRWLERYPDHIDDLPSVEYESGTLMHQRPTWYSTFSQLLALRPELPPETYLDILDEEEETRLRKRWKRRRGVLEGHLQHLGKLLEGKRPGAETSG